MPKTINQERKRSKSKRIASWDDAITDAKQRLKEIEFALQVFEQRKKQGEPWPEDGHDAAQ